MNDSARHTSKFRWVMVGMASLTSMVVYAMPLLSIPVLFSEISTDLNLTIVEVGIIWGIGSFTGMFVVLIGGTVADRFGTRKTLIFICLLTGILGTVRTLSTDFITFLATSFIFGLVLPAIPVIVHKVAGEWFPFRQLGLATGIVSSGFALGLMLGSLLGATVFSPLLGGWRGVFLMYGIVAIVMSGLWFVVHPGDEDASDRTKSKRRRVPLREALSHVAHLRSVWIIGLGTLCVWACIRGFIGYLPLYLRNIGWDETIADSSLSAFYAISLMGAIPFALLSDRFRLRRGFLMIAALAMGSGITLLSIGQGAVIFIGILIAGIVFDAYMAITQATLMEVEGVGATYAGTALGFGAMLRETGGVFAPPLGNSLTAFGLSVPFAFWGIMGLIGAIIFYMVPTKKAGPVIDIQAAGDSIKVDLP